MVVPVALWENGTINKPILLPFNAATSLNHRWCALACAKLGIDFYGNWNIVKFVIAITVWPKKSTNCASRAKPQLEVVPPLVVDMFQIGFAYRLPELANGCPFGMCDRETGTTVTSLCHIERDMRVPTDESMHIIHQKRYWFDLEPVGCWRDTLNSSPCPINNK